MARITQEIRQQNDPNYLAYSRGVDAPPPNRSYEYLFKGLGNALEGAVKAVDEGITTKARQEVGKEYDALWGDMGVDVALANEDPLNLDRARNAAKTGEAGVAVRSDPTQPGNEGGGPGAAPPAGIARTGKDLERLKAAYEDGRLNNTYYFTRAEAIARQLRARYPGYEDVVDQLIKNKLGVTPANELRKSLLNDIEVAERKRQEGMDDHLKWARNHPDKIPPDFWERQASGKPYSPMEIYDYAAKQEHAKSTVQQQTARLALHAAQGKAVATDAYEVLIGAAGQRVDSVINQTLVTLEGKQGDIFKKIQEAIKSGKPLSDKDRVEFESQFQLLETKIDEQLDVLSKDMGRHGRSLEMMIGDPTKVSQAKEQAKARLKTIREALVNGDFGLLGFTLRSIRATEANDKLRVYQSDAMRKLKAIQDVGGSTVAQYILSQNPGMLNEIQTFLKDFSLIEVMSGSKSLSNVIKDMKASPDKAVRDAAKSPEFHRRVINESLLIIQSKDSSKTVLENAAKSLFGPENRRFILGYQKQMDLFNLLVSPEMTTKMKELGGESWKNYTEWVGESFQLAHKQTFEELKSTQENNPNFKIVRNATSGLYEIEAPKDRPVTKLTAQNMQMMRRSVDAANQAIIQVLDVLKKDGKDAQQLFNLLDATGMGIPENKGPKKKGDVDKGEPRSRAFAFAPSEEMDATNPILQRTSLGSMTRTDAEEWAGRVRSHVDKENLVPEMAQLSESLLSQYPSLEMISGYRSPNYNRSVGGSRKSRHMHGDAADFALKGLTQMEKAKLIEELTSNPRVGGIGYYPNSDSIHVDLRKGRAAWGQNRRSSSVPDTPEWFRGPIMSWLGDT